MAKREIPTDRTITYRQQHRKCGKATCRTCRNGGTGHGPYWYAFWHEPGRMNRTGTHRINGQLRSAYIGKVHPQDAAVKEK